MLILLTEPRNVIGHQAAPGFDPSVIFFGLDIVPEWTIHLAAIGGIEPQLDGLGQTGLVALHAQRIISAACDDLCGDVVLASHRFDRDDGAFDVERRQ